MVVTSLLANEFAYKAKDEEARASVNWEAHELRSLFQQHLFFNGSVGGIGAR